MNKYIIEVHKTDIVYGSRYQAVFEGYDPTPIDNETPSGCKLGNGNTEMEAILDLIEQSL